MKSLSDHVLRDDLDVSGINLVEASAGTGKTYSIETLFLRLVVVEGLPVQKILVVTFTEAATKELRERLRSILDACRQWLAAPGTDPDQDRIGQVLSLHLHRCPDTLAPEHGLDDPTLRDRRLRRALLDFDQASISTIHGFCQRTLQEFAFECGLEFDAEVITDDTLLRQLCADWWRQVQYVEPVSLTGSVLRRGFPPVDELLRIAHEVLKRPRAIILPAHDPASLAEAERQLAETIRQACHYVRTHRAVLEADLAGDEAERYFSADTRARILQQLAELAAEVPPALSEALSALEQLADDLKPGTLPNRFDPPAEVAACIAACATCKHLVAHKANGITARGGTWHTSEGVETTWGEAVTRALHTVAEHGNALEEFLGSQDVARYFTKSDLAVPATRDKRLAVLARGNPGRELLTAINRVGELRTRSTVAWLCSEEMDRLRRLAAEAESLGTPLVYMAIAVGLQVTLARYDQAKREIHGLTYDDMLQRLLEALEHSDKAAALRRALRAKYGAALIDEFQDTDPVQYEIFRRVFVVEDSATEVEEALPVFLVGDPKQAIYSFRGADVFTYCAAAATAPDDKQYSLDKNFRSQVSLMDAVNTIFRDRADGSVFGMRQIGYARDLGCHGLSRQFVDEGRVDTRPFKIWDYTRAEPGGAGSTSFNSVGARMVYADVAQEIVRLLSPNRVTGFAELPGSVDPGVDVPQVTPLRASDIAILVRRHAEAASLYRELRARNVPAVRQAGDNVFDSAEAAELGYLLQAMLAPGRLAAVKTALASTLLPVSDAELVDLAADKPTSCAAAARLGIPPLPDAMDKWMLVFKEAAERWQRKNVAVALTGLMTTTGMKAWLASRPGGERRFMNIMQLHDLLHRAAADGRLGPDALYAWFLRQLHGSTRDANDAFETRLESDADAVQIMTVFKSKGLEFPVVFVPTMWTERVGTRMAACNVYHGADGQTSGSAVPPTFVHLNRKDPLARDTAKQEAQDEDIRNLYVATTRAAFRTYVVAGDLSSDREGVLARCMPRSLYREWGADPTTGIDVISRKLPAGSHAARLFRGRGPEPVLASAGTAHVDKSRRHTSFSAIAPQDHGSGDRPEVYDFDAQDVPPDASERRSPDALDIFSFPAGSQTGECWHRIFEVLDFGAGEDTVRAVVNEQLGLFRLDRGDLKTQQVKRRITFDMVRRVLHTPLDAGKARFRLADIDPGRKQAELAFSFSLRGGGMDGHGANAIRTILQKAWGNASPDPDGDQARFLHRLQRWRAEIPAGYMTGFMDLVFEHAGQYYLLDWKSNRLNRQPADFDRGGLVAEIAEHAYFLQYLIYTVAVDRYLHTCLGEAYDYQRDFGGVLYLFVRGVGRGEDASSQRGVFFTKPDVTLVRALSEVLMTASDGGGKP